MYVFGQAAFIVHPVTKIGRVFLLKRSVNHSDDGLVGGVFRKAADGGGGWAFVIHGGEAGQVDNRHGHKVGGALEQSAIFCLGQERAVF